MANVMQCLKLPMNQLPRWIFSIMQIILGLYMIVKSLVHYRIMSDQLLFQLAWSMENNLRFVSVGLKSITGLSTLGTPVACASQPSIASYNI